MIPGDVVGHSVSGSRQPSVAADWAVKPRAIRRYTVKECRDNGTGYTFSTTDGTGFVRSKADVGEAFAPGDEFDLETILFSRITGLRDTSGRWRFRMSDQDLADEHNENRRLSEDRKTINLERNMRRWSEIEGALPGWLRARIQRFRDAAGEKFLRDGWGYELAICQLAEAIADGADEDRIRELDEGIGASGNQHSLANLLAQLHADGRDDDVVAMPAGLSPITGSADYT